jgi:hypothetical protein
MPTVFRQEGFAIDVYTFDHEPAHVHIWKAGKEIVIDLGESAEAPSIRENNGMKKNEVRKAYSLVEKNLVYLRQRWREFHG